MMTEVTLTPRSSVNINMPVDGSNTTSTSTSTGNAIYKSAIYSVFQLYTSVSASPSIAIIEGSIDGTRWSPITGNTATSTLDTTGGYVAALVEQSSWRQVRCRIISATASTSCLMGA